MAELIKHWFLDPTALLFLASLLTILVLLKRRQRSSRKRGSAKWRVALVVVWIAVFLFSSAPSVVNPLLTTLEDQYPESIVCEAGSHLVMLGGGVDSRVQSNLEFERMSRSTMSRASAAARIAIDEPQLRMVVAGGPLKVISEADVIASYWQALGIDNSRVLLEGSSLNTRENAVNVAALLATETIEGPVRLVSSALHMPRALNAFRKVFEEQGIALCPVSVGREALTDLPLWAWMPQTTALVKFDKWLHEVVAFGLYRMRGWI